MKLQPKKFICKIDNSWGECSKSYVCENNLTKNEYYADTSDPQYIDNWTN